IIQLIKELKLPKRFEIKILGLTCSPKNISEFSIYLKPYLSELCKTAAQALGEIKCDQAAIELETLLIKSNDFEICGSVIRALETIGSDTAINALCKGLEKDSVSIRRLVGQSLNRLNNDDVTDNLIKALQSQNPVARSRAAEALGYIGNVEAIPHLVQIFCDENSDAKWKAAYSLCQMGNDKAFPALVKSFEELSSALNYYELAEALSLLGSEESINVLINLLEKGNDEVFYACANALGKLSCKQAIPFLLKAWTDRNYLICLQNIPGILEEIGSSKACFDLISLLKNKNLHDYQRVQAAESLGLIRCRSAIPACTRW
ncbi:MAG: HEAT repeat domain-containing protein, partial [Cyanobacteria bacterium J06649_11]